MSRTRISQNTINSSGAITGTKSHGDPRMEAGMIRCWPRKNEPDAMVSAALMRQKCRAIRAEPESPTSGCLTRIEERGPLQYQHEVASLVG
jgi:hypothetical protein